MLLRFPELAACLEAVIALRIPNTPSAINIAITTTTTSNSTNVKPLPASNSRSRLSPDTDGTWSANNPLARCKNIVIAEK
jgi:hypothetical protein